MVREATTERHPYIDPSTGFEVVQITDRPGADNTHFYFHDPAWTPDSRWLVFRSNRTERTELFRYEVETGEISPLTEGYSAGNWVSRLRPEAFYCVGTEVRTIDVETRETQTIGRLPDRMEFRSAPSENADGTLLVFGATVGDQVGIYSMHRGTGETRAIRIADDRPGHIHCSPTDPDLIMHCDATVSDAEPKQRVWILSTDGTRHWHPYTQTPQEWLTHESWLGKTGRVLICYWPTGLIEIEPDGSGFRMIAKINAWHAGATDDGRYCVVDTNWPDRGIHLIETETGRMCKVCESFNNPSGSGTHPHPSFSPDGRWIIYGSERTGSPEVYLVDTRQAIERDDRWWTPENAWDRW